MRSDAEAVLRADPVMSELLDRHDPYTERERAPYERLCVSIINQQLSTASAAAVRERVFETLGEVTPAGVLAADAEALREAGLSGSKVEYIRNAAVAFEEIGRWTAEMYLIFVLDRPDVLPLGDLAVRRGIEALYGDGGGLTRTEMREVADAWRPYRSHGTRYVWAAYEAD
ncbi:DNA-3-methyladenine glycosylase 2 family protein [Halobacteriales archaeon QS_1_69_70]|nr:MAG: DNA-3-methyladenine glycosylase 2 family protein [Halobacteriales archaeon QS_1_69_70]